METAKTFGMPSGDITTGSRPGESCIMVIFGAVGDLNKRLLMPAIYNLACDGLWPEHFAIIGADRTDLTTEQFRAKMSDEKDGIKKFNTRKDFNPAIWDRLVKGIYYVNTAPEDGFQKLAELIKKLDAELSTRDNILFYYAVPPSAFGPISDNLYKNGFQKGTGWRRIIVEKPFGTDLPSAQQLNKEILSFWDESQIYRVDHYLGKETVQNVLAFRFANGMFEPLWNKDHIDHIQFNVSESVSVEGRGGYYDHSGVLRDMMQNHMLQMLAYVCMEPPISFSADDIRNEKSKVLKAVRVYTPEEVLANTVRGQYGAGKKADGVEVPDYRKEPGVDPKSNTETFAAVRLFIDNWRWAGVPIYLRSGKALWKRGTEVVVQFKKAPSVLFRGTAVPKLAANRLIFHVQPDQAIEALISAKTPGPTMSLQPVNMRFNYGEAFRASRGTGYEVMIYSCMCGDPTLFSRTDLVETAWRIAQPLLDTWKARPAQDYPNYTAGSWGPRAAYDMLERDGRRWFEIVTRETLEKVPLFKGADPLFLSQVSMALRPNAAYEGEVIVNKGDPGSEMYVIVRGEVEVLDGAGRVKAVLGAGECFGEVALLLSEPRIATVRAKTDCDLFVLEKIDFSRILREHHQFAEAIRQMAQERYNKSVASEQLMSPS